MHVTKNGANRQTNFALKLQNRFDALEDEQTSNEIENEYIDEVCIFVLYKFFT